MIGKMQHEKAKLGVRPALVAAGVAFGLTWLSLLAAQAATYTVLHSFTGKPNDGAHGYNLVRDDAGNLYGTTYNGGPYDFGTVFKIDTAGNETVLTAFDYAHGALPQPGLIMNNRSLYVTTGSGGFSGYGAVVEIKESGKVNVLYSFCSLPSCEDGANPAYGVTRDSSGNLYGTTQSGGAYGAGVVFKVDSARNETVLYSFCPSGGICNDGGFPASGVIRDSVGNLYGSAQAGPNSRGVIWKLDRSGKETVLHAFTGSPSDGFYPVGQLAIDGEGNLFGTTWMGGSGAACGPDGCGTIFKIDSNGNETVLHSFTGGKDGGYAPNPDPQTLVLNKKGGLYGTVPNGGAYGKGGVFKLATSGKLKILYSFQGQSDGGTPSSGLLGDKHRVLYGATFRGGDLTCSEDSAGCGVVFKIAP